MQGLKKDKNLWFFARLFVSFSQAKKILSLENEKKNSFSFCILLAYSYLCRRKDINMEENDVMIAAEPAAALLSEEVRRSGILSQVMKLSQPDKVALIAYLKRGMETEEPFKTDEFGRIKLTQEMRDAAMKAERDYEDGKCLTEADFKERFAKWL
jgi:hypothetical protein